VRPGARTPSGSFSTAKFTTTRRSGEIEQKRHKFATHTDTETIVHAYEEYGDDCVAKLNGMFAFAIWDGCSEKLLLARDRIGVKPLYYYFDRNRVVFGSELKLQKRPIDLWLKLYVTKGSGLATRV
jgi:asparagine synthetase B (glutamine-hydrolysing)